MKSARIYGPHPGGMGYADVANIQFTGCELVPDEELFSLNAAATELVRLGYTKEPDGLWKAPEVKPKGKKIK